jgi:lipoyl(octanoyl) transferase
VDRGLVWRLLNTGYSNGAMNMAIDEAVMSLHRDGQSPPTLRFYRWQPPCLSIGYAQSLSREVDLEECARQGIDVVRRATGGRAVLHDREVTYSLVCRDSDPLVSGGIVESYRKISAGILSGVRRLGVDAQATQPHPGAGRGRTAACFDSPSHYEITVGGRKLVGSAQVRKGGVILQHGSILLEVDANRMTALLQLPSAEDRSRLADELERQMICLSEAMGRVVSFDEVAQAMHAAFQDTFGVPIIPGDMPEEERQLAAELLAGKYGAPAWNHLR